MTLPPSASQLASIQRGELGLVVVRCQPQPPFDADRCGPNSYDGPAGPSWFWWKGEIKKGDYSKLKYWPPSDVAKPMSCPLGKPGDMVACKERHAIDDPCDGDPVTVHYESDGMCRLFAAREPHTPLEGNDIESDDTLRTVYAGPWRPARTMPAWAARYRLRLESVGVKRVNTFDRFDGMRMGLEGPNRVSLFCRLWNEQHGLASWESDWAWFVKVEIVQGGSK